MNTNVEFKVRTITPREAEALLASNVGNRRLREGTVNRYAADMTAGRWRLSGDPIRLNGDGSLLDGQHRLRACVVSSCAFTTLVASGLTDEDKIVFDSGAARSFTDVLTWRGEKNTSSLSAAIRWCVRYEAKAERDPQFQPSHQQLLDWLAQNPGLRESVVFAASVRGRVHIPVTVLAGVHYELSRFDTADADAFFTSLRESIELTDQSPIRALRRWAERQSSSRDRPSSLVYAAVTIKAVNAWRDGRTLSMIGWRAGGAQAEAYPRLSETTI